MVGGEDFFFFYGAFVGGGGGGVGGVEADDLDGGVVAGEEVGVPGDFEGVIVSLLLLLCFGYWMGWGGLL